MSASARSSSSRSRPDSAQSEGAAEDSGGYRLPIQELRELFSLVAKDASYISTTELSKLMKTVGMPTSEEELKEFIREVDVDGNGLIDFDEFVGVMTRSVSSTHSAEEVKHAFRVFSSPAAGKKGQIRISDLQYALTHYGTIKCSHEDAVQLVSTLGLGPTDMLMYEDLVDSVAGRQDL